ncbi:hypothetical protein [Schleiferilactobacillus shenzhenensis]|nr:hypothetical protein [Schleiferilactobacillus shenzhenensis]
MLQLTILDASGNVKQGKNDYDAGPKPLHNTGTDSVFVATQKMTFTEGDVIRLHVDQVPGYYVVQFDETLAPTIVYLTVPTWDYTVTLTPNAQDARPEAAFKTARHYLSARRATRAEITSERDWALNPHDQPLVDGIFPHAHANVETRNDATFFAQNAIDGVWASSLHGEYPYMSWGINQDPHAAMTVELGRPVTISRVGVVLRADFPHDSWWQRGVLTFSDGTNEVLTFRKTGEPQYFDIQPHTATAVTFHDLQRADDSSPFPALTSLQLYGRNA